MSYLQQLHIEPSAVESAMLTINQLMVDQHDHLQALSLPQAIAWLEQQLPDTHDQLSLITWANAVEQCAAALPPRETLWSQALKAEGYTLRLRARTAVAAQPQP